VASSPPRRTHGWYGGGATAPNAPAGLAVTGTTASSVSLSWTARAVRRHDQQPGAHAQPGRHSAGLKAFSAAFVISSGCTPIWGDTLPVTSDPTVTSEITAAEADGAQPIVSFGGEYGVELADSCASLSQLTAAYQSVISTLHVTHIDFDIEGAEIAYTAQNNLRFQAINALEAANPNLVVSVTFPVSPNGPDNNGQAFLQETKSNGTRIDIINVMTMDYYGTWDSLSPNMGADAVSAAQDTLAFAQTPASRRPTSRRYSPSTPAEPGGAARPRRSGRGRAAPGLCY